MQISKQAFDIIVIGSGIGGLTVASLMSQMKHKRVLVLERHYRLGGFTHSFTRSGKRTWDVGLHYVGEMAPGTMGGQLSDLITQGGVQWNKMPSPFEKFVYPDFTFDVPDNEKEYEQALIERFPYEQAAIRQYFKDVQAVANWYKTDTVMQSAPALVRWPPQLASLGAKKLALSTTGTYLDQHFRDKQLKAVLASQWTDYGLPPAESAFAIHAVIVSHYFQGGYYPSGGAKRIAESVVPLVEAGGGQCLINHTVTEIIVQDGKALGVKTAIKKGKQYTEKEFFAPIIVSDAGAYTTFKRLLPESVSLPFRNQLERIASGGYGFLTVYLGMRENPIRLGFHGENHWIYSGYDHDAMCRQRNAVLEGTPPYCFLSFPSLKDPQAITHTAEIIAAFDYAAVEAWKDRPWRRRGDDYQALKDRIAENLLNFVEQRYPGFKDLVDFREVSTPLTVDTFTGHLRGAIYGMPATPERFQVPWLKVITPIKNLYLTGTDVAALGIYGALMGGVVTAAHLMGSLGMIQILSASKKAHA